jgi:hypothetical protein
MLYGIGSVQVGTTGLTASSLIGQNVSFPQCVAGIEFSVESTAVEASCFRNGQLVTVANKINAENAMVSLTYTNPDWATMQLLYGELARSGGAAVPNAKTVTVSGTTIVDTDIKTTNAASVRIYNDTDGVFMKLAASAPGPNEFTVAGATGTITFNAATTGDTVTYRYDKLYNTIESIGAGTTSQAFDALDDLNLVAVLSSTIHPQGIVLVAPKLSRMNSPTLSLSGDAAEITIEYKLLTPAGARRSFSLYKLDGSVATP